MLRAASYWHQKHGPEANVSLSFHSRAHIVVARNRIVAEALGSDVDWVLWLDDDVSPDHDLLERLHETGCDFVGAVAYKREPPYLPCVARLRDGKAVFFDPHPSHGIVRADLTGFACVLTNRGVLEAVSNRTAGRPFQSRDDVGEDWFFCVQAREAGVELRIVCDLEVGHATDLVVRRAHRLPFLASESRVGPCAADVTNPAA